MLPSCSGCGRALEDVVKAVQTSGRAYRWDGERFAMLDASNHRHEETTGYCCGWCGTPLTEALEAWFRAQPTEQEL